MSRAIRLLILCMLAFALLGCKSGNLSQGQRYAIAVSTYDAAVRGVVTASRTGAIKPADYLAWDANVRKPASVLLDKWAAAIASHAEFNAIDTLNALLDEMVSAQLGAERKQNEHPLGPSTRTGGRLGHQGRDRRRADRAAGRSRPHRRGALRPHCQEAVCRRARGG